MRSPISKTYSTPLTHTLDEVGKRRARKTEFVLIPEELVCFFENVGLEVKSRYAVLPYIKSSTEPMKRLLKMAQHHNQDETARTLEQQFPSLKDRLWPLPERQTNLKYKVNCKDCTWSFIDETGRASQTRRKGLKRNVGQFKYGSNIAKHAWTYGDKSKLVLK